jgi:hypothetical protein
MRREREPTDNDAETMAYTFHFQITNKGGRQACSVKVQAPNIHDARSFFRQNWPMDPAPTGQSSSPCLAKRVPLSGPGFRRDASAGSSRRDTHRARAFAPLMH